MNLGKIILLSSLVFSLQTAVFGFQGENHPVHSQEVNLIHTTVLKIEGKCCPNFKLSTMVGSFENGACHYDTETTSMEVSYCGPERSYSLNGKRLKELVGSGYTCAATHVTSSLHVDAVDEYQLIPSEDDYLGSMPSSGELKVPFVCH